MKADVKEIDQIGRKAWDSFVESHPLSNVYHHDGWHRVIEETYGYRTGYCVIDGGDGIRAALPFMLVRGPSLRRRLVSYPFSDACDPLVADGREMEAITGAVDRLLSSGAIGSAELRTYMLMEKVPGLALSSDGTYCNYVLDLKPDLKQIFRSFHKDCVQRAIRKAEKSGIEAVEGETEADLREFYRLHTATRKRLGVPVQPFRFFRNLWQELHPSGIASLLLARDRGAAVAGIVRLKFKDTVYYKFAASDRGALVKKPNHLLIWRMIEEAREEGYRYLDFGRTYVGDVGLMQWKARWGAEQKDFRYVYPGGAGKGRLNREGNRANMVLASILRRMPCFMVRASGELFYRYLA